MGPRTPVEFTHRRADGTYERVGNQVELVGAPSGDGDAQLLPIDPITGALVEIDAVHYEIHEGEAFSAGYVSPHGSLVADNDTIDLVLTTTTRYCHLTAVAAFGGDFEAYLYESPTFNADGVAVTPQNHKRTGGAATTVAVVHSPTVTNVGTLLEGAFFPGGTGGNALGAIGEQRNEWILSLATSYLIRLINRAGNAQQGSVGASWYEEEDN